MFLIEIKRKEAELMQERIGLLATADPYIAKYYSVDYIRNSILDLPSSLPKMQKWSRQTL